MATVISGDSVDEVVYHALGRLLRDGVTARPRGQETQELETVVLELRDPRDRLTRLPHRGANVFATLAETLWVLAGRDDLAFLSRFVPRMRDYSDDGVTLRGAYGPRLRRWNGGLDQPVSVYDRLREDPASRRAVISLWDPAKDATVQSKDIPCNNWLQFTIRQGRLNVSVVSRSMDIIWGATINLFEWTALQELFAHWLEVGVGTYSHFVGSLHVYDRHFKRAERILAEPFTPKPKAPLPLQIALVDLDPDLNRALATVTDPATGDGPRSQWLSTWASLLGSYAAYRSGDVDRAERSLQDLPSCDVVHEARAFLPRGAGRPT